MKRIDVPSAVNEQFVARDASAGQPGTEVSAEWLNNVQEEICSVIENNGGTLDGAQQNQLLTAIQGLVSGANGALAAKDTVGTSDIDDDAVTNVKVSNNTLTHDKLNVSNNTFDFGGKGISNYLGKVKEVTANYTLQSSDTGTVIYVNSSSNISITVPASLPVGFNLSVIRNGSGTVTFVESSTTVNSVEGNKAIKDQYGAASIISLSSNNFHLTGSLEA